MNCTSARFAMSAIDPGSRDRNAPEFADEFEHLRECPECQAYLTQVQKVDRQLAAAMQNVPVPANLKSRLMAKLSAAVVSSGNDSSTRPDAVAISGAKSSQVFTSIGDTIACEVPNPEPVVAVQVQQDQVTSALDSTGLVSAGLDRSKVVPVRQKFSRRTLLATASAAATVLIGIGFWWMWEREQRPSLSVGELLALSQAVPESGAPAFQKSFTPHLPTSEIRIPRDLLDRGATSFQLDGSGGRASRYGNRKQAGHKLGHGQSGDREIGAVFTFPVPTSRRTSLPGHLIVVDLKQIEIPHLDSMARSFDSAEVYYPEPDKFPTKVWRDDEQLYICYVGTQDPTVLESLLQQFFNS